MQIKDYDFIKDIDVLFERKIIIYGAGAYGTRTALLLEDAGVGFECFCDRDEEKKQFLDHPVITLDELQDKVKIQECIVVVGSAEYCQEMIDELNARNVSAYICTWYGVQAGIELHIEDKRFPQWFQQDIINKRKIWHLCMAYQWSSLPYIIYVFHNPIFVYALGKVGGTTIERTLNKAEIEAVHLHTLFPKGRGIEEAYACLRQRIQAKGMKIITFVRDPIARVLSLVMQHFHIPCVKSIICSYDLEAEVNRWMAERLGADEEFTWFDREIKEATGVDIYQYPFDKERGYVWIKEGNTEILLLKTEMLSKNAEVIGEFVGKPGIELVGDNIGAQKHYKYIYEELKKRIRIPTEFLDSQYRDNKCMDHFYTEEEKEQFRKKWSKNTEEKPEPQAVT